MPLTVEERNDLRKRVLLNQPLSLEEAKQVIESLRTGAAVAILAGEEKATKKSKKPAMSDEALDADLNSLGL